MNIFMMSEIIKRPIIVHEPSYLGPERKGHTGIFNSDDVYLARQPVTLVLKQQHFEPAFPVSEETDARVLLGETRIVNSYQQLQWKYEVKPKPPVKDFTDDQVQDMQEAQRDVYETVQALAKNKKMAEDAMKSDVTADSSFCDLDMTTISQSNQNESLDSANCLLADLSTMEDNDMSPNRGTRMQMPLRLEEAKKQFTPTTTNIIKSDNLRMSDGVNQVLTSLMAKVDDISARLDYFTISTKQSAVIEKKPAETENITSIRVLMMKYPELSLKLDNHDRIEEDEDFTEIVCDLCYDPLERQKVGAFKYNSSRGTEFEGVTQPTEFRNLKYRIHAHMQGKTHSGFVQKKANDDKFERKMKDKNRETGMLLGGLAYTAIKLDHSIQRYEDYVALMAGKANTGDLNHGKDFCRSFCHSVYKCLHRKMEEHLKTPLGSTGRPTPICVVADKYTPHRVTGQIIGLVAFVNGKVTDMQFDYPIVRSHGGVDLAQAIHGSLTAVFTNDHLKQRRVIAL